MIARGKREARRPWLGTQKRDEGLKGRNNRAVLRPFRAERKSLIRYQGRRASRLPLAIIFRAVGAVTYFAPLAL
jgi:hypothetical protein